MNSCVFSGRVGADAVIKYTPQGKAVAEFSLAVDTGKDKPPMWTKCTLWEKRAESLGPYIKKGIVVVVAGRVGVEAWIGKQDGSAAARITVTVNEFSFGGSPRTESDDAPATPPERSPITDEDIPF